MSSFRRRLMMAQHGGGGHEFVYLPTDFDLPRTNGAQSPTAATEDYLTAYSNYAYNETYTLKISYNRDTAPYYVDVKGIVNGLCYALVPDHSNFESAAHASIEIDFELTSCNSSNKHGVVLMLSSGEETAAVFVHRNHLIVQNYARNDYWSSLYSYTGESGVTDYFLNRRVTLKIEIEQGQAMYYLDGELLYTQSELFAADEIVGVTDGFLPPSLTAPVNCFGVKGQAEIKLYSATYKEW